MFRLFQFLKCSVTGTFVRGGVVQDARLRCEWSTTISKISVLLKRASELLVKNVSYVAANQDPTQKGSKADGLATLGAITPGFSVIARLFAAIHILRLASSNGITHSTLPVESKIRNLARAKAGTEVEEP